jgi:hypothetical protein
MYTRAELEKEGLLDFRVFLWHVWLFLRLPKPTPVQRDMARALQHGPRRMILSAFRGVGKSWITVAFVMWCLLLNPNEKILVVSANGQLAGDFTKFCRTLIDGMPLLQHLKPKEGHDSAVAFMVGPADASKDPSVKSAGITGQITGNRATIIIADDIEVPKNSYTHNLRERLATLVTEFDAILKPGGRVIYLGTPQLEQSLYNRLLARGYQMMVWPAEIPVKPESYGGRLAKFVLDRIAAGWPAGAPLDPARFTTKDLDERRLSYGRSGYALQFMLDTSMADEDRYPLKLRDCLVTDVDPDVGHLKLMWSAEPAYTMNDLPCGGLDGDVWRRPAHRSTEVAKWTGTVLAIDPSGQGKDETAYAVVRNLSGVLYVVASGGFKDGFAETTLASLAAIAAEHGVNKVLVEKNFGGGMFGQLLRPHLQRACAAAREEGAKGNSSFVEEVTSTGQKEVRILDTLEPLFQSHKLVFDRRVIEADAKVQQDDAQYSLMQQATRLTRVKGALPHDDRVEALAMACQHFAEKMGRDQDKAVERAEQAAFDKELRAFLKAANKQSAATSGRHFVAAGRGRRR